MMHCTMEDLVALRANEGSAWARRHLDACPICQGELEALYQRIARLKALPALAPSRDRWPAVLEVVRADRKHLRRRWGWVSLAAAAGLAGIIVFRPGSGGRLHADELARAKRQSASLEATLQRYDPDGRVVNGLSAALAADLEDRIAVIDGELGRLDPVAAQAPRAELVQLWQQRVNLMQQLVRVRITRAAYVGL